jgi:Uma2 family endonuclease
MSTTPTKPRRIVLGPKLAGTLMTPKEFDAVERYSKNHRYELIRGVLVVTSLPLPQETGPNDMLGYLLLAYRFQHPRGSALDGTLPQQFVRTGRSRRVADRLVWTGLGRVPDPERDLSSIAIEFVSAARRDRERDYVAKRKEYMKIRIPEYWIIDRFRRTMTVYVNGPTKPQKRIIKENEMYQTPLLPGFELPLAALLAVADSWQPGK